MADSYSLYKYTESDDYYLSYYEPLEIPFDDTDMLIVVDAKYNNKPKRLAYDLYGDENLSWVFYYFNKDKIQDIIFDLKAGMTILVPEKSRLLRYI